MGALGRNVIGWDEIAKGFAMNRMRGGARTAITWWQAEQAPLVVEAVRAGIEVVVADSKFLYFDFYQQTCGQEHEG